MALAVVAESFQAGPRENDRIPRIFQEVPQSGWDIAAQVNQRQVRLRYGAKLMLSTDAAGRHGRMGWQRR